jgi:FkbM family methyltransferase
MFINEINKVVRKFGLVPGLKVVSGLRGHRALPRGKIYQVDVPGLPHPIWLRAGTSDVRVLSQVLVAEELDFGLTETPSIIIDAGANIGISSAYFAVRHPTATVVALEIDRGNFELLRRNTASYPSIVPLHRGLWSGRTRLAITNPMADCWAFRADEASDDAESSIEAVGVADLLEEFGRPIDLLKMDIEGAEKHVFATGCDAWLSHVRTIAIELHDRFQPGCRDSLEGAIAGRDFAEYRSGEYIVLTTM